MQPSKSKSIVVFAFTGYFAFGILWSAIGPLLSQFAALNDTDLATIGGIYTAVFFGAVTAQIILGPLTDRWGQLRSLTIALLVLALGITSMSFSRWLPLTFVLAFGAGLGHGLSNLCGNVMIARLFKEKSVSAVNLLNFTWGLGAFAGPSLVSGALYLWHTGLPALWLSAAIMTAAALVLLFGFFNVPIDAPDQAAGISAQKRIHFTPFLWSMGGMLLLYVGTESAMGGWSTTYMQETTTLSIELAAMVTSGFWLALTAGRGIASVIGMRIKARHVLMLSLGAATLGTALFVAGYGNSVLSIAAILLIGLGYGAIYPTGVAMVTNAFPETPGQAGAVITAMSGTGGMIIPWLQGVVMQQAGIRSGTYLIAAVLVLLLAAFAWSQRQSRERENPALVQRDPLDQA
ncbi:MAG TPA: MFS transporter [Longilinea sp.]|nr:MFS transporter [Longilinea sp.]